MQWTTVRLVVSENDGPPSRQRNKNSQGRGDVSPLRTRRRNKVTRPEEDRTLKQWGLNAETRIGGIEPMGEISLLTFLFIGLLVS
jgi:hypothetical protein